MKVLAISAKGHEYLYKSETAHRVSERSATAIMNRLNEIGHHLKENEVWCIHDVAEWENAGLYAQDMRFTIRNGSISDHYFTAYWNGRY